MLVGGKVGDVPAGQRHVGRAGQPHRRVEARQPLYHQRLCQRVGAAAAEAFGKGHAEETQLADFFDDVAREMLGLIPVRGMRLDLALGEVRYRCANLAMLFVQFEVHV